MRAERFVYEADGWGLGELWTHGAVVVHHELLLSDVSPEAGREWAATERKALSRPDMSSVQASSPPPLGGAGPPLGTIADELSRDCVDFAPSLCARFRAHLRGEPVAYDDLELDLAWLTPLQRALADALRAVPWGEVVSYGELAALAGRPLAPRASGAFCADNRFMLIVPCHRVVAANGIGRYGASGVAVKRRLLALEGVVL